MEDILERRQKMKVTDMIVSALLKRGMVYEARNVDMEVDIPQNKTSQEDQTSEKMKIHLKVDHMSIQIEKKEQT